jgi:hypothetical protein
LSEHFDPQSELLSIVRIEEAKKIAFREHESVASFMVRLDDATNHVDTVRPVPIPLFERRQMLDTAMTNSKDPVLQNFTTHLQMAPQGGTWDELKAIVIRFDMTTAGMRRLVKNPVTEPSKIVVHPRPVGLLVLIDIFLFEARLLCVARLVAISARDSFVVSETWPAHRHCTVRPSC